MTVDDEWDDWRLYELLVLNALIDKVEKRLAFLKNKRDVILNTPQYDLF